MYHCKCINTPDSRCRCPKFGQSANLGKDLPNQLKALEQSQIIHKPIDLRIATLQGQAHLTPGERMELEILLNKKWSSESRLKI